MLLYILGIFWVLLGLLFLAFPEKVRKRIQRKGMKRVRPILFLFAWVIGGAFIAAAWDISSKVVSIFLIAIGVIAILKGMFMVKRSAAEKIIEWVSKISTNGLRGIAVLYILFGAALIGMSYLN